MKLKKVCIMFVAGIAIQAGVYFYLDQVLFAPASDFQVGGTNHHRRRQRLYLRGRQEGRTPAHQPARPQGLLLRMAAGPQSGHLRHLRPGYEDGEIRRLYRPV